MAAVVTTGTVRVNLIWSMGGTEFAVNALHYQVGPGVAITQAAADDLAADVLADFAGAGSWHTIVSNQVDLERITLRDLRTLNLPEYSSAVNQAGSVAGDPLPPQTALCVTLRTAFAGRSFRGRIYLPGAAESANDNTGKASAAAQAAALVFGNALAAQVVQGNEWVLAVRSGFNNGAARNPAISNGVTALTVRDGIWDTQRRRAYAGI